MMFPFRKEMKMKQFLVIEIVLVLLLKVLPIYAQESLENKQVGDKQDVQNISSTEDQAVKAFDAGTKYFEEKKFLPAAESFRTAYQLRPNWKLLYNIAQSEAAAKRNGIALETFEKYLTNGGDEIPKERSDEVIAEIRRLREIVGSVEIVAPDGAIVIVDGFLRETVPLPGPLLIAAGVVHNLVIKLNDIVLLQREVRVSGGQTISVEATIEEPIEKSNPVGPVQATQPKHEEQKEFEATESSLSKEPVQVEKTAGTGKRIRTAGWVSLGTGGAVLIASAVTGSIALSIKGELEPYCSDQGCPEDKWERNDQRIGLGIVTDVLIGVGAATVTAGIVMIIIGKKKEVKEKPVTVSFTGSAVTGRF